MAFKMGFEGQLFYGVAGSTASTQLGNATDVSYNIDHTRGNTTVRGTSGIPIQTEQVTQRIASIEFTMKHDTSDTSYAALLAAAAAGTAVAIRTKTYASGMGFDGDCSVTAQDGRPLEGEATTQFTCTPTLESGRTPNLWT